MNASNDVVGLNVSSCDRWDGLFEQRRPSSVAKVLLSVGYVVVFLLAVCLNLAAVCHVVKKRSHLRGSPLVLLLNVVVADLVLCVCTLPAAPYMLMYNIHWSPLPHVLCKVMTGAPTFAVVLTTWSMMSMCALTCCMHNCTQSCATVSIVITGAFVWLASAIVCLPDVYGSQVQTVQYSPDCIREFCAVTWPTSRTTQLVVAAVYFVLKFVLPAVVSAALCLTACMCAARRTNTGVSTRCLALLFTTLLVYIVCWMPLTINTLLTTFGLVTAGEHEFLIHLLVHLCAMLSIVFAPALALGTIHVNMKIRSDQ